MSLQCMGTPGHCTLSCLTYTASSSSVRQIMRSPANGALWCLRRLALEFNALLKCKGYGLDMDSLQDLITYFQDWQGTL